MAVIAVCPDPPGAAEVLDASESQYILDPDYTFVTIELAVVLNCASDRLTVVVHGNVLSGVPLDKACRKHEYRNLFASSNGDIDKQQQGIFNFSETFYQSDLPTNSGYEGPEFMARIATDQSYVYFRGCRAKVPNLGDNGINVTHAPAVASAICLTLSGGETFQKNVLYLLRLGFFISLPGRPQRKPSGLVRQFFTRSSMTFPYNVHVWAMPDESDEYKINRLAHCSDARGRCLVNLTLSHIIERLKSEIKEDSYAHPKTSKGDIAALDLDQYSTLETTDIWIVYPKRATFRFSPHAIDDTTESRPKPTKAALFPALEETNSGALPWQERHLRLGKSVPDYQGVLTKPFQVKRDYHISGEITLDGLTLSTFTTSFWRRVGLFGVLWAAVQTVFDPTNGPAAKTWLGFHPVDRFVASFFIFVAVVLLGRVSIQYWPWLRRLSGYGDSA